MKINIRSAKMCSRAWFALQNVTCRIVNIKDGMLVHHRFFTPPYVDTDWYCEVTVLTQRIMVKAKVEYEQPLVFLIVRRERVGGKIGTTDKAQRLNYSLLPQRKNMIG